MVAKEADAARLSGLCAAAYILKALAPRETKEEIAGHFEGDEQLVSMWTDFLAHNGWMLDSGN